MKRGAKISAVTDGIVLRVRQDGTKGGLHKKYGNSKPE
jgi:hypothetical protein